MGVRQRRVACRAASIRASQCIGERGALAGKQGSARQRLTGAHCGRARPRAPRISRPPSRTAARRRSKASLADVRAGALVAFAWQSRSLQARQSARCCSKSYTRRGLKSAPARETGGAVRRRMADAASKERPIPAALAHLVADDEGVSSRTSREQERCENSCGIMLMPPERYAAVRSWCRTGSLARARRRVQCVHPSGLARKASNSPSTSLPGALGARRLSET